MNIAQIKWAEKIQEEIDLYDRDLKYFLGSTGSLQNESAVGVEFETEIKTKTKLLWLQRWNKKIVKVDLQTELLGNEIFNCIYNAISKKRDEKINFLSKVESKDFCKENCCHRYPTCENKICKYCDEFAFNSNARIEIEKRPIKY